MIPSVAQIRARFNERRKGAGTLDKVLRRLLGLDAKMAQYRNGAAFVRGVMDQVGMEGFNKVWVEPANSRPRPRSATRPAGSAASTADLPPHMGPSRRSPPSGWPCAAASPTSPPARTCSSPAPAAPTPLALLAATVFESRRPGHRVTALTVDHGLQDGSAERARDLVERMRSLGAAEARAVRVEVGMAAAGPEVAPGRPLRRAGAGRGGRRRGRRTPGAHP